MRLSEERVAGVAGRIVDVLAASPSLVRFRGDRTAVARELARFLVAELRVEDEITQEATAKVASYARGVAPGSSEWEILVARHREEIAARRGYVLG